MKNLQINPVLDNFIEEFEFTIHPKREWANRNKKFLKNKYKEPYFENTVYIYNKEYMTKRKGVSEKIYLTEKKINKLNNELKKTIGALTQWGGRAIWSFNAIQVGFTRDIFRGEYQEYITRIPRLESRIIHGRKKEHRILTEIKKLKLEIERLKKIPMILRSWETETVVVDNRNKRTINQHVEKFKPTVLDCLDSEKINYEAEYKYFLEEEELDAESSIWWNSSNQPNTSNTSHQETEERICDFSEEEESVDNEDLNDDIYYLDRLDSDYEELCKHNEELLSESYVGSITYTNNTRYPNLDELESIPKFNLFPGMPSHFFTWYIEEFMKFGEGCENIILESPYNYSEEILHKIETQKHFITKEEKERQKGMTPYMGVLLIKN